MASTDEKVNPMLGFLNRLFRRDSQTALACNAPSRLHNVELDASEDKSYCVKVTFPRGCFQPGYGYSATLVQIAIAVEAEASFELLRIEKIENYLDAGDTMYVYRASNSRPNALVLLACNLTWSEQARLLASTHSIVEAEVDALRERMIERAGNLRWPNANPPK